jgi:hypothetical protein
MIVTITNSIVSKDGEEIGKIEGNVCSLLKAVGPTVKSAASAAHGSKLSFVVLDAEDGAGEDEGAEGESGPVGTPGDAGPPGPVSAPTYPKPERDPINGDKCPRLIAWKAAQKGGK